MKGVSQGNTGRLYTEKNNGWFVGFFVNEDPFRQTGNVEVKWKKHQLSDKDKSFEANHSAISMSILVKGSFQFEFRQGRRRKKLLLEERGDYVIWLPNIEHRGYAQQADTIMITLRWPSLHGDHFEVT
jgi:cupin superfamily acireductone dioxygenase involved in methionine salvage